MACWRSSHYGCYSSHVQGKGRSIGAHPGYPDLMGFGRRAMAVNPAEAKAYMIYQVGALQAFCDSYGVTLQHMKLHGAFL